MTKRPTKLSEEVLRPAMKKLFENDIKKLDDFGEDDDCIDSLVKNYQDDGFEFAKALDYDGWIIDFSVCEALDSASSYVYSQLNTALKEWYKNNPIKPFKVGDEVIVTKLYSSVKGKNCIVTSVKEDVGQYTVVEKSQYTSNSRGGYVIDHEELQVVNG